MSKKFFPLEIQIGHLKANKAVACGDVQLAKETLLKVNYYNFTACGKVKFAKARGINGKYIYEASSVDDWFAYFSLDCRLSEHLMINMIRFEREINSKTAYYISEWIKSNTSTPNERNDLKRRGG